jgi:hypothetical protein
MPAGTSCGAGVLSEWTDIDLINSGDNSEPGNGTNITTSRVATSSMSCCACWHCGVLFDVCDLQEHMRGLIAPPT